MLLLKLIKRNILIYLRDRSNIFFSLLSMIIIIGLMVIFLGKMNADSIIELLNNYGGIRDTEMDQKNADQLIMLWTLAGIVVVNSITITYSMVGIMVEDEIKKRLSSFYVSPVNRLFFVIGYVLAAVIMGIIMCTLTVAVGEVYFAMIGIDLLTPIQLVKTMIFIVLNVFTSASMVFLIMNFIHSHGALSSVNTIIGTLVGFVACIYLPMGMLPEKVQNVIKCFPLVHGSSILRDIFTSNILTKTFRNCPQELISEYKEYMCITVTYQDTIISDAFKVAFLLISGIIFIGISAIIQRKRNVMSR